MYTFDGPLAPGCIRSLKHFPSFPHSLSNLLTCPVSYFPTCFLASREWPPPGTPAGRSSWSLRQRLPLGPFGSNFSTCWSPWRSVNCSPFYRFVIILIYYVSLSYRKKLRYYEPLYELLCEHIAKSWRPSSGASRTLAFSKSVREGVR